MNFNKQTGNNFKTMNFDVFPEIEGGSATEPDCKLTASDAYLDPVYDATWDTEKVYACEVVQEGDCCKEVDKAGNYDYNSGYSMASAKEFAKEVAQALRDLEMLEAEEMVSSVLKSAPAPIVAKVEAKEGFDKGFDEEITYIAINGATNFFNYGNNNIHIGLADTATVLINGVEFDWRYLSTVVKGTVIVDVMGESIDTSFTLRLEEELPVFGRSHSQAVKEIDLETSEEESKSQEIINPSVTRYTSSDFDSVFNNDLGPFQKNGRVSSQSSSESFPNWSLNEVPGISQMNSQVVVWNPWATWNSAPNPAQIPLTTLEAYTNSKVETPIYVDPTIKMKSVVSNNKQVAKSNEASNTMSQIPLGGYTCSTPSSLVGYAGLIDDLNTLPKSTGKINSVG